MSTNPGMPCSAPVEPDNAKPQGWLWEICCSVLFLHQIPRWVYLQGSVGGWIPCGRCRNVCRERLFAICCGWEWGAGRCLQAQHPPGELPLQQQDQASCLTRMSFLQQRKTSVHGPGLLCYPGASCPTVGTWSAGAKGMWGVRDILVPTAHGSSSLTV